MSAESGTGLRGFVAAAAVLLAGCERPLGFVSQRPGCHYVICGDLVDGYDEPRCAVFVDGRNIASYATGQEALDFIRRNELRMCDSYGAQ